MICIEFDVIWKLNCLGALLNILQLRDDLELSEEDYVPVVMPSKYSSPGPWSKVGLDSYHRVPIKVHLHILTVDIN